MRCHRFARRGNFLLFARAACAFFVTAGMLMCPLSAFSAEQNRYDSWVEALKVVDKESYAEYAADQVSADYTPGVFPSKVDLRENGVVTPVKMQNPWNTCWSFAVTAASETSILSELGATYDATGLDLSERYLAWFAYSQATEDFAGSAQAGEGLKRTSSAYVGGHPYFASSLYSSGVGPVYESDAPYRGKEGLISVSVYDANNYIVAVKDLCLEEVEGYVEEQTAKGYKAVVGGYSSQDDWTLSDDLYGRSEYALEESYILPELRVLDSDGNYVGVSQEGLDAVKEQINNGRAVAMVYAYEDVNLDFPEYLKWVKYTNLDTWAIYRDTGLESSHAATIVGYDDDYAVSNFREDKQPPAPGAFLVKNSWGSSTNEIPNRKNWGERDADGNYTGYCWISYYDHTIRELSSYNYDVNSDTQNVHFDIDQYDYLVPDGTLVRKSDAKTSSANVFVADEDCVVRAVSSETAKPNMQVTYDVYALDENAQGPTDGRLAFTKDVAYDYAGYHRYLIEDENEWIALRKGQRYSVVVTQKRTENNGDQYYQTAGAGSTKLGGSHDVIRIGTYETKVNEGESWTLEPDGEWFDWKGVKDVLDTQETSWSIDNLPIKSFSEKHDWASVDELISLENAVDSAKAVLASAVVSVDGSDVSASDTWMTQDERDAFVAAIDKAGAKLDDAGSDYRNVLANTTPNSDDVNAAVASLVSPAKAGTKADASGNDDDGRKGEGADSKTNSSKSNDVAGVKSKELAISGTDVFVSVIAGVVATLVAAFIIVRRGGRTQNLH
jgi:C1A family cysteine protease